MRCFFLFKQKTAYEIRISDWSSDVCSSDLETLKRSRKSGRRPLANTGSTSSWAVIPGWSRVNLIVKLLSRGSRDWAENATTCSTQSDCAVNPKSCISTAMILIRRSEEHTSELQSLMRISYAVFCLKKKIKKT